jgi:ketosteroid isomerase-like protein
MFNSNLTIMKHSALFVAIVCLFMLPCCKNSREAADNYKADVCKEISQLGKEYFAAWENKNLDSVMFFLDKDFINMFSFGPSQNFEECRESFRNVFDTYVIEDVNYKQVECIVDHDFAFETGLFEQKWISNNSQDTISFNMRGMSVWRKQDEGSWKMFRLIAQQ